MQRAIIAVVDDDPVVLGALLDAVARRFGNDYLVVPHLGGESALADLSSRRARGEEIALVIADQNMPGMGGRELLGRVRQIDAFAKRALLVSWGDRSGAPAIVQGCAIGELDFSLFKPWSPAEIHLYPAISEFLAEWTRAFRPGLEVVRVVAEPDAPRTYELREILERNGIPHGFVPAGSPEAERILSDAGVPAARLPAVALRDGRVLQEPRNEEIADALGDFAPAELRCDLAVVGAGPAGLGAAVYGGSEGLTTIVIEPHVIGGQAGASSFIRNFFGFPRGVSGRELTQRAFQQAWVFGAKFVLARGVEALSVRGSARVLRLSDGREITARAVIVATGAQYRRLDGPGIDRFLLRGVYHTTPADARLVTGQDVYVAGGGNSAGQAAVHLAKHARSVTLVVRRGSLEAGMSDYLVQLVRRTPRLAVRLGAEVAAASGDRRLERLTLRHVAQGLEEEVPAGMLFVLIGAIPHTEWLAGAVARDAGGYVLTGADLPDGLWREGRRPHPLETSVPGVFAVGDVRSGSVKRVAAAVGEGAAAVQGVHAYLAAMPAEEAQEQEAAVEAPAARPSTPSGLRPDYAEGDRART